MLIAFALILLTLPFLLAPSSLTLFPSADGAANGHPHSHHIMLVSQSSHPYYVHNDSSHEISITEATSSNWAGYMVASSLSSPQAQVTSVYGSWTVQQVQPSSSATYSSQWIGIGGYFSGDTSLIQTGTESDSSNGGTSYGAWYEILPNSEVQISSLSISPGDKISASVVCTGSCSSSTQQWSVTITDETTKQSYTTSQSYSSSLLSAEWIEERPETCNFFSCSLTTLANFGTADYGSDYTGVPTTEYATIASNTGAIGSFSPSYVSINMVDSSGSTIAQTSALSTDGTSFTESYTGGSSGGGQGTTPSYYFADSYPNQTWVSNCGTSNNLYDPCTITGSGSNFNIGTTSQSGFSEPFSIVISGSETNDAYSRTLVVDVLNSATNQYVQEYSTTVSGSFSVTISIPSGTLSSNCPTSSPCAYTAKFELTTYVGYWTVNFGILGTVTAPTTTTTTTTSSTITTTSSSSTASSSTTTSTTTSSSSSSTTTVTSTTTSSSSQSPSFSVSASPQSLSIHRGHSGSTTLTINSLSGFSGGVSLSVSNLPRGVSGRFSTNPVTIIAGGSAQSDLSFSVARYATPGTYQVTVTGTSGSITQTTTITLTIT